MLYLHAIDHDVYHDRGHVETERKVLHRVRCVARVLLVDVVVGQQDAGNPLNNLCMLNEMGIKCIDGLVNIVLRRFQIPFPLHVLLVVSVVYVRNGRIEPKIHLNDIAKQGHHDEPEREVVQYVGHLPLYLTAVQIDQG